jgi:hypothetical protein
MFDRSSEAIFCHHLATGELHSTPSPDKRTAKLLTKKCFLLLALSAATSLYKKIRIKEYFFLFLDFFLVAQLFLVLSSRWILDPRHMSHNFNNIESHAKINFLFFSFFEFKIQFRQLKEGESVVGRKTFPILIDEKFSSATHHGSTFYNCYFEDFVSLMQKQCNASLQLHQTARFSPSCLFFFPRLRKELFRATRVQIS